MYVIEDIYWIEFWKYFYLMDECTDSLFVQIVLSIPKPLRYNISDRFFLFDIANITELLYCIQKWFINERVLLNMLLKLSVNDSPNLVSK